MIRNAGRTKTQVCLMVLVIATFTLSYGCGGETPEQMAARVDAALSEGGFSGITVATREGQPLLRGTVSSQEELDRITALVGGIEGLPGFINEIRVVVPEPELTEEELAAQARAKACSDALASATSGTIAFATSSAGLNMAAKGLLDGIVTAVGSCDSYSLTLAGHADPRGDESYNQGLSERRANAAQSYLLRKGLSSDAISTIGYGETRSLGGDLANDRRVEVSAGG